MGTGFGLKILGFTEHRALLSDEFEGWMAGKLGRVDGDKRVEWSWFRIAREIVPTKCTQNLYLRRTSSRLFDIISRA